MFIIKITVQDNSFAWNLQRVEELKRIESLENLYFILTTSAKKIDKVSIAIISSNFIFLVILEAP